MLKKLLDERRKKKTDELKRKNKAKAKIISKKAKARGKRTVIKRDYQAEKTKAKNLKKATNLGRFQTKLMKGGKKTGNLALKGAILGLKETSKGMKKYKKYKNSPARKKKRKDMFGF